MSWVDESEAEIGLSTVSHQHITLLILFLQTHLPAPRGVLPSVPISVWACSRHLTSSVGQSTTEETTAASEPARALWRGLEEEVGGEQRIVHVCMHVFVCNLCMHVCILSCICRYSHLSVPKKTNINTTYAYNAYKHMHVHIHNWIHKQIHTCMQHTKTCMHIYICICIYVFNYLYVCMHVSLGSARMYTCF